MYGSQLGTRTCDSGCSFPHVLQAPNTQPYPEDCSTYDWGNVKKWIATTQTQTKLERRQEH